MSDPVELRRFPSGDAEALRELLALYRCAGWVAAEESGEFLPRAVAGSTAAVGAFSGGKLVGFARLISDGASDGYVQDVVVAPEFRKQGIGGKLVKSVIAAGRRAGVDWIGIVGVPGSERFYQSLGLTESPGHTLWMAGSDPASEQESR